MNRKYYTLLVRENGRWGIEFGDYNRVIVADEMRCGYRVSHGAKNCKIICTGDEQDEIDAAVAKLNGGAR